MHILKVDLGCGCIKLSGGFTFLDVAIKATEGD